MSRQAYAAATERQAPEGGPSEEAGAWLEFWTESRIAGKLVPFRDGFLVVIDCEEEYELELSFDPVTLRRFITVAEVMLKDAAPSP